MRAWVLPPEEDEERICLCREIILWFVLEVKGKVVIFALQKPKGRLADRLGNGLQNRAERFDSATDLQQSASHTSNALF